MTTFCIAFYEFYLSMMLGFSWTDQQLFVVCRRSLLIWVCVAMLQLVADDLLQNDFASNMKLLQVNFPCVSVFPIRIRRIRYLWGFPDPDPFLRVRIRISLSTLDGVERTESIVF